MTRRPQNTIGFRGTITERLYRNVSIDPATGCFNYLRAKVRGYGTIGVAGAGDNQFTHRVSWQLWNGPVPEGLELHHICDNKACCNPAHLQAVTRAQHQAISPRWKGNRTHCPQGHELAGDNLVRSALKKRGVRQCAVCAKAARQRYYADNRDHVLARMAAYAQTEKGLEVRRRAGRKWYHTHKGKE